jgi:hypothetical protein
LITDVIVVLGANCPVPLDTLGVVPTHRVSVAPLDNVIVVPLLDAVAVAEYVLHCIEPDPAPGAGKIIAGMIIFI